MDVKKSSLNEIVKVIYLNKDNAKFIIKNNFITLETNLENEEGEIENKYYDRVYLHRAFPFDNPYSYISVLDKESKEIGFIKEMNDFDEQTQEIIINELHRKYYSPIITSIHSVNERYGYSYWKVATDAGDMSFTLQDTYRSILKVNTNRVFIIDMDSNRYEIPDVEKLDFKSYKKIELYL